MGAMKILFLSHMLPYPLERGGNSRTLPILEALCQSHQIYLISFVETDQEKSYIGKLKEICIGVEAVPKKIHLGRYGLMRLWVALGSIFSPQYSH